MESSQFSVSQPQFEAMEPVGKSGATCDTFRVKIYGKLHFLKRLKPEYASDIRYQEAQRKEFETGYRLEHPNIVRYVSLSDDGILMEYVDGETLSQRLADHPDYFKSRKNVDKFLRQLLDALGYLHGQQVLHLDLKPDNILLTRINDDVKLIDLGFCYTDTFADTQGHTAHFAAPEQLQGGTVDARTDIYALGKILEAQPAHARYNKVIVRCTAQNPEDRYQSVDKILYALNRRRRCSRYLSALAVILALLAAGVLLTHHQNEVPVIQGTPQDSVVQMQRDSIVQENHGDKLLDSVHQNQNLVPVTSPQPPKKDEQTLCKEEMALLIDKAYHSTIYSFRDSLFPPPVNYPGDSWADASIKFHDQVVGIGDRLVKKYPNIPESVIRQETEMKFQGLVAYVFDKMRKNANP